jgi:hypothetical protein
MSNNEVLLQLKQNVSRSVLLMARAPAAKGSLQHVQLEVQVKA